MKPARVSTFIVLFIITLFLPNAFAQDYTRWELPEGAKIRLGKGEIPVNSLNQFPPYRFSPDSTRLAVLSSIGIWLYDVQTGEEFTLLPIDTTIIQWKLAFKPNSNILASGSEDGTVRLWDVQTGDLKKRFIGHMDRITSIAFNPDGSTLASASADGTIRLWDITTEQYKTIFTGNRVDTVVLFSPDGHTLASSGRERVRLWDANTGELKTNLENTKAYPQIVYSPDGGTLAIRYYNTDEIQLWDAETGEIKTTLIGWKSENHIAFSPDGTTLATADKNYTVRLWDVQIGQPKNTLIGETNYYKAIEVSEDGVRKVRSYASKRVLSIAFSPDGNTLAVSSYGEIRLWDTSTGAHKATLTGKGRFSRLVFSPDGRTLAVSGYDYSRGEPNIYLWNIDTTDTQKSEIRHIITGHNSEVNSVAFSSDAQTLASGHEHAVRIWDVETGRIKTLCKGHPYQLQTQSIAFSPNGKVLASLSLNIQGPGIAADIPMWDANTGKYITTLKGHDQNLLGSHSVPHAGSIAFSPDGETLASGSLDNMVRLWKVKNVASGSLFHRLWGAAFGYQKALFKGHTHHVNTVAFSPDGQILASGSDDKTIRLWDLRTRKLETTLKYTDKLGSVRLNSIAFSPDGHTLASSNSDGIIKLWDSVTTEHKGTLTHENPLGYTFIAFSPDSNTLASGIASRIVIWDMQTQQSTATFTLTGSEGFVWSLKFSPDGRTLVSGNMDGTVLIWEIEP